MDAHPLCGKVEMKILGVILILLGAAALIYGGITYTHQKRILDVGPIKASKRETNTIPVPPILGVLAIAGGGFLIYAGSKK